MPDSIETLCAAIEDADAKMTKGPWRCEGTSDGHEIRMASALPRNADYTGRSPVHLIEYRHGCLIDRELPPNCGATQQALEAAENADGIAFLRNQAPLVARVIRELVARLTERALDDEEYAATHSGRDPAGAHDHGVNAAQDRAVLARVNKMIKDEKRGLTTT